MPTFHYENESLPSPDDFRRQLREASDNYDPLEELLGLERELAKYEREYNVTSAEFHQRFLAGETGDDPEIVGWMGRYEAYLHLKSAITESLRMVLVDTPTTTGD